MTADGDLAPTAADARPVLGFRVGVTGHRKIDAAVAADIERAAGGVLDDVASILTEAMRNPEARPLYRDGAPILRLVSPLAEGADRLVARAALQRGWRLAAPLPFRRDEYEKDFPNSIADFSALLASAQAKGQVVELDGRRAMENAAYLQVGRFVLDHSDLLIAVWDGNPAVGEGGTGQIVDEAKSAGIPIVHINVAPPFPALLLAEGEEPTVYDRTVLATVIHRLLLPRWSGERRDHRRAVAAYWREPIVSTGMAPDFLYRGPFAAKPIRLARLFPYFVRTLGGRVSSTEIVRKASPPAGADNPAVRTLYLHYQRADALATHYAALHRSGFMMIYFLGALSLTAAYVSQYAFAAKAEGALRWVPELGEAAAWALIALIVLLERQFRWRERWLDYRQLAEMLREADLLAQLGGIPLTGGFNRTHELHPERGWIPWLVGAIGRSLGIVGGRYDAVYLAAVRDFAAMTRFPDQIAYHERTEKRMRRISRILKYFSYAAFGVSIGPIVAQFFAEDRSIYIMLAGVIPAAAAAGFGIRNQAEFEIVVHRSARLRERLVEQRNRLLKLTGAAITAASLGREIRRGAATMQRDTADWAEIFEVKESDVS